VSDIRVGNIHVSANGIRVDDSAAFDVPLPEPSPVLRLLASERVPRALLLGFGLVLAVGGMVGLVLSGRLDLETFLLRGGALIPMGMAFAGLGMALPLVRGWARQEMLRHEAGVLEPAAARLRTHIGPMNRACTIAALVRTTGLPTPDVVRALRWMRDTGEIEEDLDIESNEFYYGVARGQSLEDRHDALPGGRLL
jgi:hypothetical protein